MGKQKVAANAGSSAGATERADWTELPESGGTARTWQSVEVAANTVFVFRAAAGERMNARIRASTYIRTFNGTAHAHAHAWFTPNQCTVPSTGGVCTNLTDGSLSTYHSIVAGGESGRLVVDLVAATPTHATTE